MFTLRVVAGLRCLKTTTTTTTPVFVSLLSSSRYVNTLIKNKYIHNVSVTEFSSTLQDFVQCRRTFSSNNYCLTSANISNQKSLQVHTTKKVQYYSSSSTQSSSSSSKTTTTPVTKTFTDNDHDGNLNIKSTTENSNNKNNSNTIEQRRWRRCLFSVPGHVPKMIQKAMTITADAIVFDLEDGVPLNQKDNARQLIYDTLSNNNNNTSIQFGQAELCIRINDITTSTALQDLLTLVPCYPKLQTIIIPKVESASDIYYVRRLIDSIQPTNTIRLFAAIESAMGMLNIRDIAQTSIQGNTKLDGLIFASEDYCNNIEAIRTVNGTELLWARSTLVNTAKAYQLEAIDMVHINFRNIDELNIECQNGVEIGFTGKQAIHPLQVQPIQLAFTPSISKITFATKCITQFNGTPIEIDGIVVDTPVYKWAQKILQRANNKAPAT